MVNVILPDGSKLPFDAPVCGIDVAQTISAGLAKNAVAMKLNGAVVDLSAPIVAESAVVFLTPKDKETLDILRHTAAHVLAMAVKSLYPEALVTIGPAVENGFYYDFYGIVVKEGDLPKIEAKMAEIVAKDYPIVRSEVPRAEAVRLFEKAGERFKAELVADLPADVKAVSLYTMGDSVELCRGPHLPSSGKVGKAFKLTKVAAAYWRGDAKRESLQRIYGTAFWSDKELKAYFTLLEEAEKRDHRKLGKALELWHLDDTAPGCPYFLPRGVKMINALIDFWRAEHEKRGYDEFSGAMINGSSLWKTSGHWDHYKDDMYILNGEEDKEVFALKPMSCPNAIKVYNLKTRSYADLPLRLSDVDYIHRNEASGALCGLFRVREFRQDDAHIFVTEDMIADEYNRIFDLIEYFYKVFGLSCSVKLSTRPDNYIGDLESWNKAEAGLRAIMDARYGAGKYEVKEKDGAFYGPKIDIQMRDSLGREWQMGTIQLDFQLAKRFGCTYADKDGTEKTPVIIHRTVYGSLERFIALITEHFAGAFPVWIAPVQARVLPVSDKHRDAAVEVLRKLKDAGIRAEMERQSNTIGYQIREAHQAKIPYAVILGDKEIESGSVSVRLRDNTQVNAIPLSDLIGRITEKIKTKALDL
ncbi:MAG: threonine--tRNA ligase [Alphaproteobacteria bacterium]|nr:threonine--tRNA ligase [Alphaproteobacteria bacterium]